MKAASIFGGVQIFNIIIQLIRSKVVAVLLGPSGMGVLGLLQSTISLVASATHFGLGTSAVRDISEANSMEDEEKIAEVVSVFRKLVWLTGLLGMTVTIILSPILSKLTFGNYNYTIAFVVISCTLLFSQLASGQLVLLQGLRHIKWLAKANVYASVFGLLVSLPLYYFFGYNGIVPGIIAAGIITLLVQYYFAKRIHIKSKIVTLKEAIAKGKGMLKMGFMLSLSGLISVTASYVIRIFISNFGNLEDVGFYNAGFAIIGTYVGLVFSAMGTDYYPRLSAINTNTKKLNELIKQQSEIAIFILAPLICIFLIFIDWITILLYSEKFLPISEMIHWAVLGVFFKAVSWSIAFVILAKGDSKLFFWNELIANLYLLILNISGYYFFGLEGLGISFLLGYFLYTLQVYLVCSRRYKIRLSISFFRTFLFYLILGLFSFIISISLEGWKLYVSGSLIIIFTSVISLISLDHRIQIFSMFKNKFIK